MAFSYRGDEVAAQASSGSVRYDIIFDPAKTRWYLDASWKTPLTTIPTLDELGNSPVLSVDLNVGHLAAGVVDVSGNLVGKPLSFGLELTGLSNTTRDGRLRRLSPA
ncbi:MAG: hypothetical protein ACYCZV_07470 [Acidimicrobiales bacterium]